VERVWFRYPGAEDRGWVLEDVSFRVEAGQSLAIVGATGSGKSTLAELLSRSYDPDRGRVLLDGIDIRALSLEELRGNLGVVPQETFLFSATVRDNILLGAPDDGRLDRVSEVSQLAEAVPDLPHGYDTILGERGINLSGGQKQRAAIARALAPNLDYLNVIAGTSATVSGATHIVPSMANPHGYVAPFARKVKQATGAAVFVAGRINQLITSSTGLDDWEWGVSLHSDDALAFKKLIYEMRFDEASAKFAEFGPFYIGLQFAPTQLGAMLAGRVPTMQL